MKLDDMSKEPHEFIEKWEKNIFTFLLKNDKDRVSGPAMYKKLFGTKCQRAIMAKQRWQKNNNKDIILSKWQNGNRFQSQWIKSLSSCFLFFYILFSFMEKYYFVCSPVHFMICHLFIISHFPLTDFHFFLNILILFHFSKLIYFFVFSFI